MMLVLSPKLFNQHTGIVIGLPMRTAQYNDTNLAVPRSRRHFLKTDLHAIRCSHWSGQTVPAGALIKKVTAAQLNRRLTTLTIPNASALFPNQSR